MASKESKSGRGRSRSQTGPKRERPERQRDVWAEALEQVWQIGPERESNAALSPEYNLDIDPPADEEVWWRRLRQAAGQRLATDAEMTSWVMANALVPLPEVELATVPSLEAVTWLRAIRENSLTLNMVVSTRFKEALLKGQVDAQEARREDHRPIEELIAEVEKELKAAELAERESAPG